jgi:hypothetical protein
MAPTTWPSTLTEADVTLDATAFMTADDAKRPPPRRAYPVQMQQTKHDGSIRSISSPGSILSIGSSGSILSIGSAGSILSIGSAGSILSLGSALSFASVLSVCSFGSAGAAFSYRRLTWLTVRSLALAAANMAAHNLGAVNRRGAVTRG